MEIQVITPDPGQWWNGTLDWMIDSSAYRFDL